MKFFSKKVRKDYCVYYAVSEGNTVIIKARFSSEYTPMEYHDSIYTTCKKYTKGNMYDILAFLVRIYRMHYQNMDIQPCKYLPDSASSTSGKKLYLEDMFNKQNSNNHDN